MFVDMHLLCNITYPSVSLIIDSDMFFIKDISIEEMIQGYNISFIPSYRYSRKSDNDSREITDILGMGL